MKPALFITNCFDRPCERLIAVEREGSLYYLHPEMQAEWKDRPMSMSESTSLEDFGIKLDCADGWLVGVLFPKRAKATYPDGKPRKWQGAPIFRFAYDPDFTFNTPP